MSVSDAARSAHLAAIADMTAPALIDALRSAVAGEWFTPVSESCALMARAADILEHIAGQDQ